MDGLDQINKLIIQATDLVNSDKYVQASHVLQSILSNEKYVKNLTSNNWQLIAHLYLLIGKFDLSKSAYLNAGNQEGVVFISILLNKLEEAKDLLSKTVSSPANQWCNFLIELFSEQKRIKSWPSFFMIRHFMEFTVFCLLLSQNTRFIQVLFKNLNRLLMINQDTEKLIGYAYSHFGKFDEAIKLLNNAASRDQFDGEIYYRLAKIYLLKNNPIDALSMLQNAELFLPEHYPTKVLTEKVRLKLQEIT